MDLSTHNIFSVLAQTPIDTVKSSISSIHVIVTVLIVLLMIFIVIYFISNTLTVMRGEKTEGRKNTERLFFIVVLIAIGISIWGIIDFLQDMFGVRGVTEGVPDLKVLEIPSIN